MIYYKTFGRGKPLAASCTAAPARRTIISCPISLPLARHYRLIFIDERGSGRSQTLEDASGYTVENMVEDVEAVRQALELGQDQPARALLRRRAGAGLRAEVPAESFSSDPRQHLLQHQGHQ